MKKQKQGRLLCALCLALLLIPLAGMLLAGPSDAVSNERLAAKPRLMRAGKLNPDFLSETADYFAGHFYLRPALITANRTVQAAVFRESASEDVVLGDGGWLFYADTLEDFQGTNPMTGRALFCAARNLALLQEFCAQQGTSFLFVCAPNKNTIYPEYMPGQYRKTEQVSDLDRLEQALTQQGVSFCDLREAGVVDPAKVTRVALENAASVAGMFLTTECVICDKKEDKPEMPMGNPGMGGMM